MCIYKTHIKVAWVIEVLRLRSILWGLCGNILGNPFSIMRMLLRNFADQLIM